MKSQLLLIASLLFVGPALAAKPQIQWNTDYDFSAVDTFQWKPVSAGSLASTDPFLHSRIINAIEFQLTGFGLTETVQQ